MKNPTLILGCLVASLILIIAPINKAAEINDSALRYYIEKVDSVLNQSALYDTELKLSFKLNSIYDNINYRGVTDKIDTASFLVKYSNAAVVSSETLDSSGLKENVIPPKLNFEKPWELDCRFYFYPNDTGAGNIAIGFEPLNDDGIGVPAGLIEINRESYQIHSLYFHYGNIDKYLWLSKTYYFSDEFGNLLPNELIIQGCFYGFFQRRYFRQDLRFESLNVNSDK